ncbi:uncharacterized protein [Apostichopus japonicus]|uniref:uncharacterized protein n=1 Tax=Stichopus japonicus TaxID=307972 RepID=UPI003AB8A7DC
MARFIIYVITLFGAIVVPSLGLPDFGAVFDQIFGRDVTIDDPRPAYRQMLQADRVALLRMDLTTTLVEIHAIHTTILARYSQVKPNGPVWTDMIEILNYIDQIATTLNPKLLNLNDLSTAMYNVRISADTGSEDILQCGSFLQQYGLFPSDVKNIEDITSKLRTVWLDILQDARNEADLLVNSYALSTSEIDEYLDTIRLAQEITDYILLNFQRDICETAKGIEMLFNNNGGSVSDDGSGPRLQSGSAEVDVDAPSGTAGVTGIGSGNVVPGTGTDGSGLGHESGSAAVNVDDPSGTAGVPGSGTGGGNVVPGSGTDGSGPGNESGSAAVNVDDRSGTAGVPGPGTGGGNGVPGSGTGGGNGVPESGTGGGDGVPESGTGGGDGSAPISGSGTGAGDGTKSNAALTRELILKELLSYMDREM